MSSGPRQSPHSAWPPLRALARELGLGMLALIGVAIIAAAVMIGLILLLYGSH